MNAITSKPSIIPSLLSLVLVVALGASLAKLMWLVISPKEQVLIQSPDEDIGNNNKKQIINYGKIIADHHIFGETKKKVAKKVVIEKKPVKKPIAKAKLNLTLHGIVAYKNRDGFALISLNRGPQKVYGVNEIIQDGVVVKDILSTKVILENQGVNEELLLPVKKDKTSRKSSPPRRLALGATKRQKTNSPSDSTNKQNLGEFRQEVISNPRKLMDIAKPSPAVVDGQFLGFKVQPGKNNKLFESLGFLPNDIITEVNGIILDEQSKGAMVLGELAQAADISVKVKRGDQEVFLQHTF